MSNSESSPVYAHQFWAKSEPRHGYPKRVHLLEHHLADVGACFEALLAQPTIRQRLARSGGLEDLDPTTVARLCLFAALHDIGKVNVGFQTQIWRDSDFNDERRPTAFYQAGHYREMAPVLRGEDRATSDWFFENLGWWHEAAQGWDDAQGETVCALFIAALSHHGRPMQLEGELNSNARLWGRCGGLVPAEGVRRVGELSRQWFPDAFDDGSPPLPPPPEFQHMFLGLCTLADWIGSNEDWFPFCDQPRDQYIDDAREMAGRAMKSIGLDLSEQRGEFPTTLPGFAELFDIPGAPPPNAIQTAVVETPLDERLVIIESETGSGKTEAALWRFAGMYEAGLVDGLYFALPTRAAASQLHQRVTRFVDRMFPAAHRPEPVLAVPGYLRAGDVTGRRLQDYDVWWDSHHQDSRRWAAESSKRCLAAQIAVGTVDQAMMAALKVKHAHMRAACLSRNLLVVDEVHASDPYMRRIIKALLDAHLDAGGYALLMSATLGSAARRQWLPGGRFHRDDAPALDEAVACPYPAVSTRDTGGENMTAAGGNGQEKNVDITAEPLINDFDQVAGMALRAAEAGAKVLVIRNTVSHAIATQQALEQAAGGDLRLLFSANGAATLHHSRFAVEDRRLLDGEVERRLGKGRDPGGVVVVGTQTLEQSLDIDADLLIADLCPVDVLLQRIGRLHRHDRHDRPTDYERPRCVVLTPDSTDDLSPLLQRGGPNRTGLGPHGYVYEDLRVLEATRRLIGQYPRWDIPRMNRELVEKATHPAALEDIVKELGDDWQVHANKVTGGELADGLTAANAVARRDKSFFTDNREVLFGSDEERIRTRLGDEGIEVEFDPAPVSPFDASRSIGGMTIPEHLLRGATADAPVAPNLVEGDFSFAVGDRAFRYDRLGLRRDG